MKSFGRIFAGIFSLTIIALFVLWPMPSQTPTTPQRAAQGVDSVLQPGYNFQNSLLGQAIGSSQGITNEQGPTVGEPVEPGLSPAVRDLPPENNQPILNREINPRQNQNLLNVDPNNLDPFDTGQPDPLVQRSRKASRQTPAIITSFEGIDLATGGSGIPPDTVGDVGPNHYVQMVNSSFAIYNKSGTRLTGPTNINQLWTGQGNICETRNDGDPIVLYDRQADRWMLSQFSGDNTGPGPYAVCMAVSQTADPTGAYHIYTFIVPEFPDYLKFGVWPDAYYMGSNESSYVAYAFDRTNMLNGATARAFIRFPGETNLLQPADLDGATAPAAAAPGIFFTFKDDNSHGGADRLEIFEFTTDFDTPANSALNMVTSINIASFTHTVCGNTLDCIPQPGTAQRLDAVSDWPLYRLQYRNFGSYETLVGNFTVDAGGDQAAIRWFELRRTGGGAWTLNQEGTHAPDAEHRFMGSIAMDKAGNIALGYSVSSNTTFPSIRYATRLAGDTLGTLQTEATIIAGTGSQTLNRWGDYSSMNVDPADDCTFWYTNEYMTAADSWQTRIASFKEASCGTALPLDKFVYLPLVTK